MTTPSGPVTLAQVRAHQESTTLTPTVPGVRPLANRQTLTPPLAQSDQPRAWANDPNVHSPDDHSGPIGTNRQVASRVAHWKHRPHP
jgi:hypothetical protein